MDPLDFSISYGQLLEGSLRSAQSLVGTISLSFSVWLVLCVQMSEVYDWHRLSKQHLNSNG